LAYGIFAPYFFSHNGNNRHDEVTAQAKTSPRLCQAFDLRDTPEYNFQRMLNAIEPGTLMPNHRLLVYCEDNLYKSKVAFNSVFSDYHFTIGKQIFDLAKCDELGNIRKESDSVFDETSSYFPVYRAV